MPNKPQRVWRVEITTSAQRVIKRLSKTAKDDVRRIRAAIDTIRENPYFRGPKKFQHYSGYKNMRRYTVGKYCIFFAIEKDELVIIIVTIDPI